MYYIIPMTPKGLDMDNTQMIQAIDLRDGKNYIVKVVDGAEPRDSWKLATEDQFNQALAGTFSMEDYKRAKKDELNSAYQQALAAGFEVTISGTTYTLGWSTDDKANLGLCQQAVDKGFATFPITYADVNGNPVPIPDQDTLNIIEITANKFAFAQHQQILNLIGQANSAGDVDTVNKIQWTPAPY